MRPRRCSAVHAVAAVSRATAPHRPPRTPAARPRAAVGRGRVAGWLRGDRPRRDHRSHASSTRHTPVAVAVVLFCVVCWCWVVCVVVVVVFVVWLSCWWCLFCWCVFCFFLLC